MEKNVLKKIQAEVTRYFESRLNSDPHSCSDGHVVLKRSALDVVFSGDDIISTPVLELLISVAKKFDVVFYVHKSYDNDGLVFTML